MSLIDDLWRHVRATGQDRTVPPPLKPTNLWQDLDSVRAMVATQRAQQLDLVEAVGYLAGVVEALQAKINALEAGNG